MARFQSGCVGSGQEATRLGTAGTGADGFAAGWLGRVTVRAYSEHESDGNSDGDRYSVRLGPHRDSGGQTWTLATGHLDANRNPAPDVARALVRLVSELVRECEARFKDATGGLDSARERLEDAQRAAGRCLADVNMPDGSGDTPMVMERYLAAERAKKAAERAVKLAQKAVRVVKSTRPGSATGTPATRPPSWRAPTQARPT